jgi:hypothetical protein
VCRTTYKYHESLEKSADLTNKSDDDTVKLKKIVAHLAKMMKDEKGDGDNDIWINKEGQIAYEPLIKNNYFHVDIKSKAIMKGMGHMNKMSN